MFNLLLEKAYALCVKCNQQIIMLDLHAMTESELAGVVILLTRWRDS